MIADQGKGWEVDIRCRGVDRVLINNTKVLICDLSKSGRETTIGFEKV